MSLSPTIDSIYTCARAGEKMIRQEKVKLIKGIGIDGDRYALGLGAYSNLTPKKIRDVSIIAKVGTEISNRLLKYDGLVEFNLSETRRNIVIDQMEPVALNALVGKVFYLGNIKLQGTEFCDPCERPAKLLNKKGFMKAYDNHGGIRAEVLGTGEIKIGDRLICNEK